jgi:hypothetical protein
MDLISSKFFKENLFNFFFSNRRIRRRADSYLFKKFVKYERNYLSFNYLDESHPQLGGKINVETNEINFSQFRSHTLQQVGYFTDDKIVFVQFNSG